MNAHQVAPRRGFGLSLAAVVCFLGLLEWPVHVPKSGHVVREGALKAIALAIGWKRLREG
jgi:hypothetical protein